MHLGVLRHRRAADGAALAVVGRHRADGAAGKVDGTAADRAVLDQAAVLRRKAARRAVGGGDGGPRRDFRIADGRTRRVGARDAADGIAGAAWRHLPHHGQVAHHGTFLQSVKQPGVGILPGEGKSADGVAAAFKCPAEGWDGQKILRIFIQGDVMIQDHGLALGPCVQPAAFRQDLQILLGLDVDGAVLGLGGVGQRRKQKTCQQNDRKAGGDPPLFFLFKVIPFHLHPPPMQCRKSDSGLPRRPR